MRFKGIPRPLFGVAVAVALIAGACSSEQPTEIQASVETETAADTDAATDSSDAESDSAAEGPEPEGTDQPADSAEETAAPSSHLFPNLNTVNIVDGATVNLAEELAGGDTPVLLWFWAPH